MLCFPGFTPVAKLDQAVGDSEGWVDASTENVPVSASRLRFGSLPSSIHLFARVGSIPSKPITKTRCLVRRSGLPGGCVEQPSMRKATATARTKAVHFAGPERSIKPPRKETKTSLKLHYRVKGVVRRTGGPAPALFGTPLGVIEQGGSVIVPLGPALPSRE